MMRPDQIQKLKVLGEKLFNVVVLEADPANWSSDGRAPKDLSPQERGDAVWCRKQAAASLSLLLRVQTLTDSLETGTPVAFVPETGDLEQDISRAEAEADKMLRKLGLAVAGLKH